MRLQLEICRNRLPVVKILWTSDRESLVSQLLSDVDAIVPLEAEEWGIDDYILETAAGFEALHFQKLGDIVREDDYLRIRPLSSNDIRARRVTARTQINGAGRHLIDGVPYGQPMLRQPSRPMLGIAPRKSVDWVPHIEDDDLEVDTLTDDDGKEDAIYDTEDLEAISSAGLLQRRSTRVTPTQGVNHGSAMVLYNEGEEDEDGEEDGDDDEDDDGDYEDQDGSDSESSSSSGSAPAATTSMSGHKRVHWSSDDIVANGGVEDMTRTAQVSEAPPSKRLKLSSATRSADSDSSEKVTPQVSGHTEKQHHVQDYSSQPLVPPGKGMNRTKARNKRRLIAKKLSYLKQQGILPANADAQALLQLDAERPAEKPMPEATSSDKPPDVTSISSESKAESESESEDSDSDDSSDSDSDSGREDDESESSSDSDSTPSEVRSTKPIVNGHTHPRSLKLVSDDAEFQKRREALLAQLGNGGIDVTQGSSGKSPRPNGVAPSPSTESPGAHHQETPASTTIRQKKLDTRASQRLVLGSLGQRVPRNATERAKLVEKMATPTKKVVPAEATTDVAKDPAAILMAEMAQKDVGLKILMRKIAARTATEQEKERFAQVAARCRAELCATTNNDANGSDGDFDFWKQHIDLTAVECCEEDVQLSTPPFPFYQRWDPSQRRGKKAKRQEQYEEQDDSYFGNGEEGGDGLNYDDEGAEEVEEWDRIDEEQFAEAEDDLPALPSDVTTLPQIKEADLQPGDVIVFKNLEVSAATNWTPAVSPLRTGMVLNEQVITGQTISLRLAWRDLPERKYDDDGNRVYEKFEMQHGEDEGEEEGLLDLSFADLVEPRLLSRQPAA